MARKRQKPSPDEIAEALKMPTISPEALHRLGVLPLCRSGVYAACRSGELESVRFGRKVVIVTAPLRRKLGIDA